MRHKMAIICLDCGNTGKFEGDAEGTCHWDGTAIIDGESEEARDINMDSQDDEEVEDITNMTCCKCHSENVEQGKEEDEILRIKWAHTDKEGDWHKKELPEDERNEELRDEVLTNDI
jgi:hypothetical protein